MQAEAGMGKAAGERSQPGGQLSQEAGRRGEGPVPDTILGALGCMKIVCSLDFQ